MPARALDLRKRSVQNWIFLVPLFLLIAVRLPLWLAGRGHHTWLAGPKSNGIVNTLGLALIAIGLAVRVCARGWKVENSGGQLVTTGLYAYIRHPLYVASFLIGLGLCLILGDLVVLAVYVPLYLAMHAWVIHGEEGWMASHWGDDYRRYAARVPRFLPQPHSLTHRERVRPRQMARAIAREADAVCAWPALAFLLLGWESLSYGANPIAVVPFALAAACVVLWPTLQRAARRR